jgi:ribosome-associated protein
MMGGHRSEVPAIATTRRPVQPDLTASRRHAVVAAGAALDKKATEVVVLEVGDIIAITDCFVVATAGNARHVRTVVEEVEEQLGVLEDVKPLRIEGLDDATWVLMDYGHLVVHVFQRETRDYYQLERLWADAPRIEVDEQGPASAVAR